MRLRSPIGYYGGKFYLVKEILPLIPEHQTYVEVFGGGAQLLFAKPPSPIEIYNDVDSLLVNFFRVLREPELFIRFYQKVIWIPFSREEYKENIENLGKSSDPVENAVNFFIACRQSFSGTFSGWGFSKTVSRRGMALKTSGYLDIFHILPLIHQRLFPVQIENDDFEKIIERYDTENTFFYCDPPYLTETLKTDSPYKFVFSADDHKRLLDILLKIKGKVLLSGYPSELYKKLEKVWSVKKVERMLSAVTTSHYKQIECLWYNYETTEEKSSLEKYVQVG